VLVEIVVQVGEAVLVLGSIIVEISSFRYFLGLDEVWRDAASLGRSCVVSWFLQRVIWVDLFLALAQAVNVVFKALRLFSVLFQSFLGC